MVSGEWRPRAGAVWVVAAFSVGAVVRPALAQPGAPPDEDRRAALYRAGVDAAAAGRWAEAREDFQAALALRASPRIFFSLAQCEEQLGQLASAEADYARAERWAREASGDADVVSAAEHAERALGPRVPHLRVTVATTDGVSSSSPEPGRSLDGASVTLDDAAIAADAAVAVDPGVHRVVVRAPGMRAASVTAAVGEGQQLEVPVRLDAEVAAPAAPVAPAAERATPAAPATGPAVPWRAVGAAAGVAGVVGVGVGAYFGAVAKWKNDQSYADGCRGDDCPLAAAQVRRDAIGAANASTGLIVAGSLLAVGGVVLWIVAPAGGGKSGVGVGPMPVASGAGAAVEGTWW